MAEQEVIGEFRVLTLEEFASRAKEENKAASMDIVVPVTAMTRAHYEVYRQELIRLIMYMKAAVRSVEEML